MRKWRALNPYKARENTRRGNEKWRKEKHEDYIESKAKHRQNIRLKIIDFYGGKCVSCGITDFRVLQVDHINGDGYKSKTKAVYFNWSFIKSNPDIAKKTRQLLCANCNWIKRFENKEYRRH